MRYVGIDFGTCNLKGSEIKKNRKINYIKFGNKIGKPRLPNVILYETKDKGYKILVGDSASKKPVSEQDKVRNIKSYLQEKDWTRELSFGKEVNAYDVVLDIMRYLYDEIHKANKNEDISATITVPVNFSKRQQVIIEKAAQEAGFIVNAIITEPFAALLFLMKDNLDDEENHRILVFDFGGGTLDLCLAEIKNTTQGTKIETQATVGITYGGNDLNKDIIEKILKIKKPKEIELALESSKDKFMTNKYKLMEGIDELKEELFEDDIVIESKSAEIIVTFSNSDNQLVNFGEISVEDIYKVLDADNWKFRIYKLIDKLFDDSDMIPEEITDVFIVGGTGSIPYFKSVLKEYFIKYNHQDIESIFEMNDDIDAEERLYTAVSAGAALYKDLTEDETIIIKDKIPFMVYAKDENNKKCAKITKNDYFKDYASSLAPITKAIRQKGYISIYQTIFGEEDKEVFLGNIYLDEEMISYATLYRLTVNKERMIQMELGYLLEDDDEVDIEDNFCIDWQIELKIEI